MNAIYKTINTTDNYNKQILHIIHMHIKYKDTFYMIATVHHSLVV